MKLNPDFESVMICHTVCIYFQNHIHDLPPEVVSHGSEITHNIFVVTEQRTILRDFCIVFVHFIKIKKVLIKWVAF